MIALTKALFVAERIQEELRQYCEQISIAGSIRRAREHVNDIDFVVLPKPGQVEELTQRIRKNTQLVSWGEQIGIVRLSSGLQVDFYFAHGERSDLLAREPSNWGSVLLCRTGSKEHNIYLAQAAQALGYKWDTTRGIVSEDKVIAGSTEEEIFDVLRLAMVPPALRER